MSSASSGSGTGLTTSSSRNRSTMSYTACDYGLVIVQRFLICCSILLGYDLLFAPRDFPKICLVRVVTRIIRNFFFVTKAVRKWLAINYNDGVIPEPALRSAANRPSTRRMHRSTPRDSALAMGSTTVGGSLKQSPIERRYSEPPSNYDFATALKDRHNRSHGAADDHHRHYADVHSSDFLWHSSSLSFRFLLNSLAQSFLGYIEDPDPPEEEEVDSNKRDGVFVVSDADGGKQKQQKIVAQGACEASSLQSQISTTSTGGNASENRRRNEMVVKSVLDDDAQQQNLLMNSSNSPLASQPLPAPNFDDSASPKHPPIPSHQQTPNMPIPTIDI